MFITVLLIIITSCFGKWLSLYIYRSTWENGMLPRHHPCGAFARFLLRPRQWYMHVLFLFIVISLEWSALPGLQTFVCVNATALSVAAVGRIGAVDKGSLFIFDRIIIVLLCIGVWLTPFFLIPLLLSISCLQYTVAGSVFSPGYSNLLGFEFIRSSLCYVYAGLVVIALSTAIDTPVTVEYVFLVVLCFQASSYVQHAVAKNILGSGWFSWIRDNRLECLFVNAYLRGWLSTTLSVRRVILLTKLISRHRVSICFLVWVVEFAWLFVVSNRTLALTIIGMTLLLHIGIWLLTGFVSYLYVLNHIALIGVMVGNMSSTIIGYHYLLLFAICVITHTCSVLLLRYKMMHGLSHKDDVSKWGRWFDPANHLMAWWDSPYMRMYSYYVKTTSGVEYHFPVTRFSPYDTFLTDVHTHIMVLGRHWDVDASVDEDRDKIRSGVWGLLVFPSDKAIMSNISKMNTKERQSYLCSDNIASSYIARAGAKSELSLAYQNFFCALNGYINKKLFKLLFRRPHFPGEDWVPDRSPLLGQGTSTYCGQEPIAEVSIRCIKTFFTGEQIELIANNEVARITIPQKTACV